MDEKATRMRTGTSGKSKSRNSVHGGGNTFKEMRNNSSTNETTHQGKTFLKIFRSFEFSEYRMSSCHESGFVLNVWETVVSAADKVSALMESIYLCRERCDKAGDKRKHREPPALFVCFVAGSSFVTSKQAALQPL